MDYEIRHVELYRNDDETVRIDDDEEVLTAWGSGPNVQMYILSPVEKPESDEKGAESGAEASQVEQCTYTKDNGERCQRSAQDLSRYCWEHGGED